MATRSWSIRSRTASRSTRTMRVAGTPVPVAICDSSRSRRKMMSSGGLSVRASVSWEVWHAAERPGPGSASAERLVERSDGGGRDHRRDVPAERGDLTNEPRADGAVLRRGNEADRVEVGGEATVVLGEVQLALEVRDAAEAADD